jgi:2,3-dihydroxybiphenyl 1,2-dioxygenase
MDILGIGYLGFESPEAKAWLEYGTEVLGLGLADARDGDGETVYLRMDDRRWRIAMHPGASDRLAYIGWEVTDRTAFRAAIAKLDAAGVEVTHGDDALRENRGVRDVVRFKDPVGYQHELFYGQEFHPNSFMPGRPHHGFVAEENGVGHVVLIIPEYPDALDTFLTDVMGFRWFGTGMGGGKFGFYRAKLNAESHNIAYGEFPGYFGIHHIGMVVQAVDDVGISYDLVQEREIPLQMTLGRHTQDPVISFYHFTPSNFVIEYLWEGDKEFQKYEVRPSQLSVWGHKAVGPPIPSTVAPVAS